MKLDWSPQDSFKDFFVPDAQTIIRNRSVFNPNYEYYVPYGGRGSGKTWTFADACVVEGSLRPVRILVTRELQNSIEESIKSEIELAIHGRGLANSFYKIQVQDITAANGTKFIFKGLKNNINSIKSISDVDIVLAEESEGITQTSWNKLLPSIRPRSGRPPIIIVVFNPEDELDDTFQRFVVNPPPRCISKLINWSDNKYFPEHLNIQRLHCKKTMPLKVYNNIWEGVPRGSDGDTIIDRNWIRAARFASKLDGFVKTGDRVVAYDPSGQGRDENAVIYADGNIIVDIDEWLKSDDLRSATRRSMEMIRKYDAEIYRYDECGGFGDGISVFVDDIIEGLDDEIGPFDLEVKPFNAGDQVALPDELIDGTEKTNSETYANLKAQAHGVTAQLLYNTYRFVVLGEKVDPSLMISIDIDDDQVFNKLVKELSLPIWVKSAVNSKRKVEDKKAMIKRTEQPSPNMADAFHMIFCPHDEQRGFFDVWLDKKMA